MKRDDGGPAFPATDSLSTHNGMTLRDYFAAKFAHAELNTAGMRKGPARALAEEAQRSGRDVEEQIAYNAYRLAEAMLRERNRPR